VLLCFLTFGSYWCYDIPSALEIPLESYLKIGDSKFALLYTVYNTMNIGIVLCGGYFIDRIGLRVGAVLFCFFIALGQVVVSIGISISNIHTAYVVMLLGRIVFSIGGESLGVAQSTFCSKWFKGKDLAFAFGITLSFARVGSYANMVVTPDLAQNSLKMAFWFGTLTCLISLLMTALASVSDKIRDSRVKSEEIVASTPFNWRDIFLFPASLWLIYLICVFYYIGVFILISVSGQRYMLVTYGFHKKDIGSVLGIPYLMSAILAPFMGFGVDRVGGKPYWMAMCSIIIGGAYAILIFGPTDTTMWSPYGFTMYASPCIAMILMGFSYSLCAASLWPCVPLLVEDRIVGTAYGIMNSIQNGGLAIASVVVGHLTCGDDVPHCVTPPLYLLASFSVLTLITSVLLIIYDRRNGRKLTQKSSAIEPAKVLTEAEPLINK